MFGSKGLATGLAVAFAAISCIPGAMAGTKYEVDENTWASIGMGTRFSYRFTDTDGDEWGGSRDFETESFRLYFKAQFNDWLGIAVNTEKDNSNDDWIRLLDAVLRLEFHDMVNFWAGRMLQPLDRSNMNGPFNLGIWDFPKVQRYTSIWKGRDNGAAIWGQVDGGRFKYHLGAFEGCKDSHVCDIGHDAEDPMFTGRLTYNFWDPEPGYYNKSDYFGEKEILAFGIAFQHQADIAGIKTDPDDFFAWNIDALMQKRVASGGVFTLEAAYYDYDKNGNLANPTLPEGESHFILASYLFPQEIWLGKFQPVVRYQKLDLNSGLQWTRQEFGLNYIMRGHNLRLSLVMGTQKTRGQKKTHDVVLGLQFQY